MARIVPLRFGDRTLGSYLPVGASQAAALRAAQRLVAGEIANLVLVGPTGLGKTHLAAGIVNALVAREDGAYQDAVDAMGEKGDLWPAVPILPAWLNVADAIAAMRLEMDAPADDRDATIALRRARTHHALVVLDDLGREKASDWTGEIVYALVNARYEGRLPTIITSNLTPAELAASSYWTSVSRLAEDGELVQLDGPDHRLAPA